MTQIDRPDEPRTTSGELPEGVDPLGVPGERSGHNAFILTSAAVAAVLALIFTLSWVVYHQLAPESGNHGPTHGRQTAPTSPTAPELT
ncbi:MAG: hypothetical protein ABJA81_07920 [Nocardioidaceae bacterium]